MSEDKTWSESDKEASSRLSWESVYTSHTNKRGRGYVQISCPFPDHDDSTASCTLYDDGHYHCFGCNDTGGMAKFLVKAGEFADWGAALSHIQKLAGIETKRHVKKSPSKPRPSHPRKPQKETSGSQRDAPTDWRQKGSELWKAATQDLGGTVAEKYLTNRCPVAMEGNVHASNGYTDTGNLRFVHPENHLIPPWAAKKHGKSELGFGGILIARYSYPRLHESFEVEFLTRDGVKAPKKETRRMTWGARTPGSACWVWKGDGDALVVCEGVMSAFASPWCVAQDDGLDVKVGSAVAVGGKNNMDGLVEHLGVWMERTGCKRVVIATELGDLEHAELARMMIERMPGRIRCDVHTHYGSDDGWDCADQMSVSQHDSSVSVGVSSIDGFSYERYSVHKGEYLVLTDVEDVVNNLERYIVADANRRHIRSVSDIGSVCYATNGSVKGFTAMVGI